MVVVDHDYDQGKENDKKSSFSADKTSASEDWLSPKTIFLLIS